MRIEIWKCDVCDIEITEEIAKQNNTMVHIAEKMYFTGDLCEICVQELKAKLKSNGK